MKVSISLTPKYATEASALTALKSLEDQADIRKPELSTETKYASFMTDMGNLNTLLNISSKDGIQPIGAAKGQIASRLTEILEELTQAFSAFNYEQKQELTSKFIETAEYLAESISGFEKGQIEKLSKAFHAMKDLVMPNASRGGKAILNSASNDINRALGIEPAVRKFRF